MFHAAEHGPDLHSLRLRVLARGQFVGRSAVRAKSQRRKASQRRTRLL